MFILLRLFSTPRREDALSRCIAINCGAKSGIRLNFLRDISPNLFQNQSQGGKCSPGLGEKFLPLETLLDAYLIGGQCKMYFDISIDNYTYDYSDTSHIITSVDLEVKNNVQFSFSDCLDLIMTS